MRVLSLFDGMSCGQQALDRIGLKVDTYFASEIDKYAIQVTMANYPNTIQLGSVVDVNGYDLPKIDLLIGGSPCQSFSFAGKRKGMSTKDEQEILTLEHYLQLKSEGYEFEGQSYLFWEYMRLLHEVKPKYFLLENVMMGEKWEKVLSKAIGVNAIEINSSLVSAQNRRRLYWTNIGMESGGLFGDLESIIKQPKDKGILLKDILESDVDEKYFLSDKMISWLDRHSIKMGIEIKKLNENQKSSCLTSSAQTKQNLSTDYIIQNREVRQLNPSLESGGVQPYQQNRVYDADGISPALCAFKSDLNIKLNNQIRRLTPVECERLQTVKDNYTNYVSDSQRYRMLGNGWTVDVIAHIFGYIK
jgi:DNA (cytosine-5)-methyltransferase 1